MTPGSEDRTVTMFNDVDLFPSSLEMGPGAGPPSVSLFGRAPKLAPKSASAEALPKGTPASSQEPHLKLILTSTREAEPQNIVPHGSSSLSSYLVRERERESMR